VTKVFLRGQGIIKLRKPSHIFVAIEMRGKLGRGKVRRGDFGIKQTRFPERLPMHRQKLVASKNSFCLDLSKRKGDWSRSINTILSPKEACKSAAGYINNCRPTEDLRHGITRRGGEEAFGKKDQS